MPKDQFKTRLEIAKSKILEKNLYKDKEPPSSIGTAFKMSTELVSAVAVGTIIGFILDKTFGTKPWLILIFFFVGVIAGIVNVFKSAKRMQK
jgi:ATP synthase protein I